MLLEKPCQDGKEASLNLAPFFSICRGALISQLGPLTP